MDRRSILKLAAGAALVDLAAAGAAPAQPVAVQGKGLPGKDYAAVIERLRAFADAHVKAYGLPAMTVGLVDADGFSADFQLGWADVDRREPLGPDHLIQIGSISKAFASICLFQRLGVDGLNRPVAEFLPEIPLPPEPRITVRHLLNHSAGLPDDAPFFPRSPDGRLWYGFPAGSQSSYSNTGYAMAGMIVERLSGQSYDLAVRDQVFKRLGMDATEGFIRTSDRARYAVGYQAYLQDRGLPRRERLAFAPWTDFQEASGSIASTAREMNRYVAWIIRAANGKGAPLLSEEQAKLFCTPQVKAPYFSASSQYAFGLATVQVEGRECLHHTGGMVQFSSAMTIDAPAGVGVFASTNCNIQDYRPRQVAAYGVMLLRALREGRPLPQAPEIDTGEAVADGGEFVGRFLSADGTAAEVAPDAGGLLIRAGGTQGSLQRKGANEFLAAHPRFARWTVAFQREGKQVSGFWWGSTWFAKGKAPARVEVPEALKRYEGRYDNDDPWRGGFRVAARPDGLYLDGVTPLVAHADGSWRLGPDPAGCERVWFDGMLNGRSTRLVFSGADYLRRHDEV
ncbi:MAG: beta-lactamase family protein [Proteobacteria bacterium]|nr:beta-lactamase family protein [Pseudomonadota bacterium]